MPGRDGLLHVSELSWDRIDNVADVLEEGQMIKVRLMEIDPKTGKFRLSAKVFQDKPEGYVERPATPRPPRPEGDRRDRGDRGGDRRDRGDRGPRTREN
jgi:polyribonucleotide nucleotidyltransferase